jgi:DinB superfamily
MKRKSKTAKRGKAGSGSDRALRKQLVQLLEGGGAHVRFSEALADFPADKRGAFAEGLPHTGWQLLEHARIAQWDILEFSRNAKHVSPDFPDGYWPQTTAPPDDAAWKKSLRAFERDLRDMLALVSNPRVDLHAPFAWGNGQTVLREALLIADHNAYHLGQLVDLRRALKVWLQS